MKRLGVISVPVTGRFFYQQKEKLFFCGLFFLFSPLRSCSVFGYCGGMPCKKIILESLQRLEHQGYDSAGCAFLQAQTHELVSIKAKGKVANLMIAAIDEQRDGTTGIGHTRWATQGAVTRENAHPHLDCSERIAIVHRGYIANHALLKDELIAQGHTFLSETDSEVIPHVIEQALSQGESPLGAMVRVASVLQGVYAVLFIAAAHPDELFVVCKGSGLYAGFSDTGIFLASSCSAFSTDVWQVATLPNSCIAHCSKGGLVVYDYDLHPCVYEKEPFDSSFFSYDMRMYETFMSKEMHEQKNIIQTLVQRYSMNDDFCRREKELFLNARELHLFASGFTMHIAAVAKLFMQSIAQLPTYVHCASEVTMQPWLADEGALGMVMPQADETADITRAIESIALKGMPALVLSPYKTSRLAKKTDGMFVIPAGQEIAVASTKQFTASVAFFYWLAHYRAQKKGLITEYALHRAEQDLLHAAQVIELMLQTYGEEVSCLWSDALRDVDRCMVIGRHATYPLACESALLLQELVYCSATAHRAGELRYGPLALVDAYTPVFIFSHQDPVIYKKLLFNAQEVKTRHGKLIAFAFAGQDELINVADYAFIVPRVGPLLEPLVMTVLAQLLAHEGAQVRGYDVDRPRNIAKVVRK